MPKASDLTGRHGTPAGFHVLKEIRFVLALVTVISLAAVLIAACSARTEPDSRTTGSLQFLVDDTETNPLEGAKVVSFSQPGRQLKLSGITGADGIVVFSGIIAGDYEFQISRFDFVPLEVAAMVTEGQVKRIEVHLTRSGQTTTSPSTSPALVSFAQLIAAPEAYNGRVVSIQGFWFDGFEIVVLAQRLDPSSFTSGNVQPGGALIWVKGGLPEDAGERLYLQPNNPTGYPAHYGKVELTGLFVFGGKYGHLNAYQYQLTLQTARLLPFAP